MVHVHLLYKADWKYHIARVYRRNAGCISYRFLESTTFNESTDSLKHPSSLSVCFNFSGESYFQPAYDKSQREIKELMLDLNCGFIHGAQKVRIMQGNRMDRWMDGKNREVEESMVLGDF